MKRGGCLKSQDSCHIELVDTSTGSVRQEWSIKFVYISTSSI